MSFQTLYDFHFKRKYFEESHSYRSIEGKNALKEANMNCAPYFKSYGNYFPTIDEIFL